MCGTENHQLPIKIMEVFTTFPGSKRAQKSISQYDCNGKLQAVEHQMYINQELKDTSRDIYRYEGQEVTIEQFDRSGALRGSEKIQYDAQGRKEATTSYEPDGLAYYEITFRYNDQGQLTERYTVPSSDESTRTVFFYDEAGRLMADETCRIEDHAVLAKSTYTYDATGKLMEQVELERPFTGEGTNHIYAYDAKGLLSKEFISKLSARGQTPLFMSEYTYQFY